MCLYRTVLVTTESGNFPGTLPAFDSLDSPRVFGLNVGSNHVERGPRSVTLHWLEEHDGREMAE